MSAIADQPDAIFKECVATVLNILCLMSCTDLHFFGGYYSFL